MSLAKRLASQSSVIFAARIFGAGIIFIAQAAMARIWGAHVLGNFMLIMAVVNLIIVFLPLGFQTIGTYFTSEYRARNDGKMLKSFIWRSYSHIGIMAILIALIIVPCCIYFSEIGAKLAIYWLPIIIIATSGAIMYVNSAILVGLKKPFAAYFTEALFRPILLLIAFIIAAIIFSDKNSLTTMLNLMSIGFMALALIQFLLVIFVVNKIEERVASRKVETSRWWRFALPWVLIALASDFFFDIDIIILAYFLPTHEIAIFGVIAKIFSLAAFGITAVYAVCLPDMFESEANNDRNGFLRKVGEANLVAAALSLLLLVGVLILGHFILSIFGEDFTKGFWALVILCSALLVRSIFGPASLVLSIYDRPYASLPAVFLGLGSLVLFNYLLVPNYNLIGAAFAALIAITIWSLVQWVIAFRLAKVDISIFASIKSSIFLLLKPE